MRSMEGAGPGAVHSVRCEVCSVLPVKGEDLAVQTRLVLNTLD